MTGFGLIIINPYLDNLIWPIARVTQIVVIIILKMPLIRQLRLIMHCADDYAKAENCNHKKTYLHYLNKTASSRL